MHSMQDVRHLEHRKSKGQLQKLLPHMKQSKPKKERPEYRFGSNVSLNSSIPARHLGAQVPQELSLEKVQSKDGFIINYLRVYCERVRQGDHFKTIRVHGGSTARKCLKELVDIYYTKIGAPEQFQLFEVFGRIAPVNGIGDNNETVLAFTEVKCRPIPPEETIHDLFSSTAPGSGLSRRIELRSCQHPFVQPSTMSRSSHTSSNDIPATPTTPPLRRSVTPGGSRMTFRDSRRKRVPRVTHPPDGPYFLMLRGSQPQKDSLIYDLSSLVQKNSTRSEITIGSRPSADICIHSAPGETLPQREQITFAKLVGYDQPLTVDGTNILTGAIYLEPELSEWNTEGKTPLDIPYIAVNDEILVQPNSPFFKPRLLRPGDLVYFGSTNRGYVFLFKDPRWIPDHRLVLGLPAPKADSVVENHGPRINGYSVNLVEQVRYAEKSSDTDSSNSLQALGRKTLSELIPRSVYLRQVISNLFTQPISVMTSRHAANDPFGASNWSRIDPWRSAGLFAHLIRSTAHFVITPNPAAPNTDIDQLNPHAIQDYAINRLKDMHALLLECHQTVFAKGVALVFPNLWISLFCYDLAVLLTPGWLSSNSPGRRFVRPDTVKIDRMAADGSESSESSSRHLRLEKSIENLPVVSELRDCALQLAEESIQVVVQMAFQEIAPYTTTFCQDNEHSPIPDHADPSKMTFRSHYPDLCIRLNKFANCLLSSLHPSGTEEFDHGTSTGSSPFHTISTDSSGLASDRPSGRVTKIISQPYRYNLADSSEHSLSTGTEGETGDTDIGTVRSGSTDVRNEAHTRRAAAGCGGRIHSTEYRILAIVWRQLLAALSHHLLDVLLKTGTILIDWNTGERLLSGVTWLQEWLATNGLRAHRRPLSMITEFASLLATPKDQMLRMTWDSFRSMYPEIHPALLKFMLKEYSVDVHSVPYDAWAVDPQDETAANEDPFEVIQGIFDSWCARERIQYQKPQQHSGPAYRPMDPRAFFRLSGTEEFIKRLDLQLEGQSIKFRWAELIKQFPPPRVTTHSSTTTTTSNGGVTRPQSRQRLSGNRAHRSGSSCGRIDPRVFLPDATAVPRATSTPIRTDAPVRTSKSPEMFYAKDTWNSPTKKNVTYFPEHIRPAQSHGEPMRVIRSFSTEFQHNTELRRNHPDLNSSTAMHPAFSQMDLQPLNGHFQRPHTAMNRCRMPLEMNQRMGRNVMYESQPNIRSLKERQLVQQNQQQFWVDQTNLTPKSQFGSHDFSATYSPRSPRFEQPLSGGRLSHSMWQLPMNSYDGPLRSQVDSEFANNISSITRDYEHFRMSLLGKGLDRLRSPMFDSPALAPKNPLKGQMGQGLGTLNTSIPHSLHQTPNIIVEEAPGSHSSSETNSVIGRSSLMQPRDDDLADVISRNCQGNTVANITLSRTPDISFGLVLVDGERTALDQPGVFVKSLTDNGVASQNGEINFGDRILAINGQDLTAMTYSEALKLLKACKTQATFTVRRCDLVDPGLLLIPKINA